MTTSNGAQTTLADLVRLINAILPHAVYEVTFQGSMSQSRLQQLFHSRDDQHRFLAGGARPALTDQHLALVVDHVAMLFKERIEADPNGRQTVVEPGIMGFFGGPTPLNLTLFTEKLIVASAILGAEKAVAVVDASMRGEPIRYAENVALIGLSINQQPVELSDTVAISGPLRTMTEVPSMFPIVTEESNPADLLGRIVLSIQYEARAAPRPSKGLRGGPPLTTPANDALPDLTWDDLCKALSLACDVHIDWLHSWESYGDLDVFRWSSGSRGRRGTSRWSSDATVGPADWVLAVKILDGLTRNSAKNSPVYQATERWWASKRQQNVVDQFGDLRTALERLFAPRHDRGIKSRVADNGAKFLANDDAERQEYQRTLRKAYSIGSDAVHLGSVEPTDENKRVLTQAQALCRRGILRQLEEARGPV